MSEQMIIEQCSPTLAGLKTGNLFPCKFESKEQLLADIRRFNRSLVAKGVRIIPIRVEEDKALIYLYRPEKLRQDLSNEDALEILRSHGYKEVPKSDRCVAELMRRFKSQKNFPHEIGLFLGYPPEDVKGFIEHRDEGCKCVGYWKVYGDAKQAEKRFNSYRKCTRIYKEQYSKGKTIEHLTVGN